MIKLAYAVVLLCSMFGGVAQLLLKKGSDKIVFGYELLKNYYLIGGLALYGVAFLLYTLMLKNSEVSKLYPIISLSYVWVVILAYMFLGESLTIAKISGSMMIVAGVYLMAIY